METEPFKPPYMSFLTFWNFLGDLAAKPLPRTLDRSIMTSKSGTDQNNLMAALATFGFIDTDGTVKPRLVEFAATNTEGRTAMLAELVYTYYAGPIAVSKQNGSPAALADSFRDTLGQNAPDTRRKSITFFLHAAAAAGIELSPHFPKTRSGSGSPGTPKPRRTPKRKANGDNDASPVNNTSATPNISGYSRTVELKSGGTVTLIYNVNMMTSDDKDELFVLDLVRKLRSYQRGSSGDGTDGGGS